MNVWMAVAVTIFVFSSSSFAGGWSGQSALGGAHLGSFGSGLTDEWNRNWIVTMETAQTDIVVRVYYFNKGDPKRQYLAAEDFRHGIYREIRGTYYIKNDEFFVSIDRQTCRGPRSALFTFKPGRASERLFLGIEVLPISIQRGITYLRRLPGDPLEELRRNGMVTSEEDVRCNLMPMN